jgi:nitronate monooxygenase
VAVGHLPLVVDLDEDGAGEGYPQIHHLTAPLRAHGRAVGDPGLVNLWAGQAHAVARSEPAAEIVRRVAEDARAALRRATELLD